MATHELKIWPEYFEAIIAGTKTFDLRKNDRDFQVGDILWLREWHPNGHYYSGRETMQRVTYILPHLPMAGCAATFGLQPGHVVMAICAPSRPRVADDT